MTRKLHNRQGFTLIELLITVVIIGLVAALAMPNFTKAWERQKFRGGNGDLISRIKTARSHAISSKIPYGVYIDSDSKSFTIFKDVANLGGRTFDSGDSVISVDTLPSEFEMIYTDVENSVIMFNANGSADFGGYGSIVTYGCTEQTVSVSQIMVLASTGRVTANSDYY